MSNALLARQIYAQALAERPGPQQALTRPARLARDKSREQPGKPGDALGLARPAGLAFGTILSQVLAARPS